MKVNYVPRVTQLDALQLDSEVLMIFKEKLGNGLKYFSPGFLSIYQPELDLILQTIIWKYSIFKAGASFGQQLLTIKYDDDKLNKSKLVLHFIFTIGLKYCKEKTNMSLIKYKKLQNFTHNVETLLVIGSLFNFLRFLRVGKWPTLTEYILGMNHVSMVGNQHRNIGYSHMTRELIWAGFIELLLFTAPLVNYHALKRKVKTFLSRGVSYGLAKNINTRSDPVVFTLTTRCACCNERPSLPHTLGCSHLFCYYCLKGNLLADPQFQCPICDFAGGHFERVTPPPSYS